MDKVIVKRCKSEPRVPIAFIVDAPANPGMIVCYAHDGQHGEASYEFYRECHTVSVADADVAALLAELRTIRYEPLLMKRMRRRKPCNTP